jgi:hypothetical protein
VKEFSNYSSPLGKKHGFKNIDYNIFFRKKVAVLITRDRKYSDYNVVETEILDISPIIDILILGDAKGADTLAKLVSLNNKDKILDFNIHKADWNKFKNAAGLIRNSAMINQLYDLPDNEYDKHILLLGAERGSSELAFHNDIVNSRGTKSCIDIAEKKGFTVKLIERK